MLSEIQLVSAAIIAATDPQLLFGLSRSDLVSISAIAISATTTVMVTRHQLKATRQRDQEVAQAAALAEERDARQRNISATLDFHREYNSTEMAAVREGAHRFVLMNSGIDWETEPELMTFNRNEVTAVSLFELMRFFQRVSVVWALERLDEKLLAELLGHEVAWWQGIVFEAMGDRPSSRTLPAVKALIAGLRTPERAEEWDEVVTQAVTYRVAAAAPKPFMPNGETTR